MWELVSLPVVIKEKDSLLSFLYPHITQLWLTDIQQIAPIRFTYQLNLLEDFKYHKKTTLHLAELKWIVKDFPIPNQGILLFIYWHTNTNTMLTIRGQEWSMQNSLGCSTSSVHKPRETVFLFPSPLYSGQVSTLLCAPKSTKSKSRATSFPCI